MLRLGLEKLAVRRRLPAECLCGGLPFPTGFRVGAGVVPALADTSTARNKKTRTNSHKSTVLLIIKDIPGSVSETKPSLASIYLIINDIFDRAVEGMRRGQA